MTRILLIEDNLDHIQLIEAMFKEGFGREDVLCNTLSLSEGMVKLEAEDFDICWCDLSFPDSGIPDTIRALAALDVSTPIIVLTSLDDDGIEKELLQSGIQDFLPKNELSPKSLHRLSRHAIERKRLTNEIASLAITDPLTGLYNRREFDRRLEELSAEAKRYDKQFSLALIDVDNFKDINDNHGHPQGDLVLTSIAAVLDAELRDTDSSFRFGGDEFAVLLPHVSAEGVLPCFRRIQSKLEDLRSTDEAGLYGCTLSIGLAQATPGISTREIVAAADKALYNAKGSGRNCISISDANGKAQSVLVG